MSNSVPVQSMRRQAFGASILILVQASIGMIVNLDVTVPSHHSGANPANYATGSWRSLVWGVDHGAIALVLHIVLGLLLAVMVIGIVSSAMKINRRSITILSVVSALLVIGAGFNGVSSLDYNKNVSSLIMALLAFGALTGYSCIVYLLPTADSSKR